jgi:hypothetical protein
MAHAQHEPLRPASDAEQQALTALVKAMSARVDRVRRARALLAVAEPEETVAGWNAEPTPFVWGGKRQARRERARQRRIDGSAACRSITYLRHDPLVLALSSYSSLVPFRWLIVYTV